MDKRTTIEWNKDDIDALGFLKIDVLGLGMLTCIRKAFELAKIHYGKDFTLASIPQDDPAVYDMICKADTIGVFQIESRAQKAMLPRLKPRTFYDLVIEVAIVRPGPIQGDMVHPYLRRRTGEEPVEYPSEELRQILGRTLGVPLFQEQAMKIAIVAAGFTPAEADELRRSMATFKFQGLVNKFQEKLIGGMVARGYQREFAERVFRQLEGFGSYGFPESHAAYQAQTGFQRHGIKGVSLSQEDRNILIEQGLDPDAIDYAGTDLEILVSNRDTIRRQWEEIFNVCIKDTSGSVPGKTIVFAMTKEHGRRVREVFEELFPQYVGMLQVIYSGIERVQDGPYGDGLITKFKKEDKPRIAVSVDMLEAADRRARLIRSPLT